MKTLTFEYFTEQAQDYLNQLCHQLDHPDEQMRVLRIWRSVAHTLRDRLPLEEAFQTMLPLPVIFRGIYTEEWNLSSHPSLDYSSLEEMKTQVKELQAQYGEEEFAWSKSTEKIIATTFFSLEAFLGKDQLEYIMNQLPSEIKEYLRAEENNS